MSELDRRDSEAIRRIEKFNLGEIGVKSDKANHVIRFKAFSWTRLFNLLQEVQPYNVQMMSIHPVFRGDPGRMRTAVEDPDQVPVSVEGVAKSLKDLLELERSLIGSAHFDRVDPEHYAVDEHTREVIFRMRFLYDPRVALEQEVLLAADSAPVEGDSPPAAEPDSGEASAEAAAETGAKPPAVAAATTAADDVEPSGALDSGKLKKIDRRGQGKRGARNNDPAAQPEAPPTAPADDADEREDR